MLGHGTGQVQSLSVRKWSQEDPLDESNEIRGFSFEPSETVEMDTALDFADKIDFEGSYFR